MNDSMVLKFQAMALDNETSVTTLLRMAKAIASKLELSDVSEWIDNELNGYAEKKVPEYRKVRGILKAIHPMHGLVEAPVPSKDLEDKLSTIYIKQSLGELESVSPKHDMHFPLPTQLSHSLQASQPEFLRFSLVRVIGSNKLINIAEQVRNRLLSWSLELEQQGILGENLQFSQQDKNRAPMTTNNFNFSGTVNNAGVMGSDNHDFSQKNSIQIATGDFSALENRLKELGFAADDIAELKVTLDSEPLPADKASFLPKVYSWLSKAGGKLMDASFDKVAPLAIEAISKYLS